MYLVAKILGTPDSEKMYHYRKFYWNKLLQSNDTKGNYSSVFGPSGSQIQALAAIIKLKIPAQLA